MKSKRFTGSVIGISKPILSISFRLLIFNVLLVFLPIAALLYLNIYEKQLLVFQEKSMVQQARLISASLSGFDDLDKEKIDHIFINLANKTNTRLRVVDEQLTLLADSSSNFSVEEKEVEDLDNSLRPIEKKVDEESFLYRSAIYPVQLYRKIFNPPVPVESESYYSATQPFIGKEIEAALDGRYGAVTRLSSRGQKSVTLYIAIPIVNGDDVIGVVLASQSTFGILKDLYESRLFILRNFLFSFIVAIGISFFLSRTISHRIKRLEKEARAIGTGRGRIKGTFTKPILHDEIGYLNSSLIDLTDRLDRHIQFIDSFSKDISHEFKNPLAVIKSASEMMGSAQVEQQVRFIELIDLNTRRMDSLLNSIEDISSLDTQLDREQKVSILMVPFLEKLIEGFKLQYKERVWSLIVNSKNPLIWASPERLGQIFVNLFENAATFSHRDGGIRCTIRSNKKMMEISVYNDGQLIPEEDLENIFHRFFTSRQEQKEKHHGLGLSIVKTIVDTYGGSVSVENRSKGVAFIILFPLMD